MVRDRPTERKMPVVPDPAERLSVMEERQKVNSATSTLKTVASTLSKLYIVASTPSKLSLALPNNN